jgi:hypothetical protein
MLADELMPTATLAPLIIWVAVFFGGVYAVQMIRGLRDAGRRALGPGVLLLLAWVMIAGLNVFTLWLFSWLTTHLVTVAAIAVFAVIGFVVLLPVGLALTSMIFAARRRMAPEGRALLKRDRRPPILYLRSFTDDQTESGNPDLGGALWGTYEERLFRSMRSYGPVVAIGRPGDPMPPLGAARMYVDDAGWKDVVKELVARAQLVVLRPGITGALLWEAETVAQVAGRDKIAFYVRGLPAAVWAQFVKELGTTLDIPLPSRLGSDVIVLYLRDGAVRDLRWQESPPVTTPGMQQPQYVPTRQFVKPLFRS